MHVGLLTTSYPRFAGDYAGCFVADRAAALAGRGHTVEVLAAAARDGAADLAPAGGPISITRIEGGGALFYRDGAPEALERDGWSAWAAAARFSVALATAARARAARWDAVESHWLVPSALVAAAVTPRLPRRAFAHSGDVALLERLPFGRALARTLARRGGDLSFVSDDLRCRFARLAGTSSAIGTVAPLPLPDRSFTPRRGTDAAARRALALAAPTVLAVGRLVPIKGHDVLLRACARIAAARRPEVVILGDGSARDDLGRLAATLGVRVRLPGFVARAEVARWLRAADVFAQPSIALPSGRTEGVPIATREALAVGIPVVASASGGLAALASSATLVAPGDIAALAAALARHWQELRV